MVERQNLLPVYFMAYRNLLQMKIFRSRIISRVEFIRLIIHFHYSI